MDNCLADREGHLQKKNTSVKDNLHKISGVDQGNAQQIIKTITYVQVVIELYFVLLIQYLLISQSDSWLNFFLK